MGGICKDTICPKCRTDNAFIMEDFHDGTQKTHCVDCGYEDQKLSWVGFRNLICSEAFLPKEILTQKLLIKENNTVLYLKDYYSFKYVGSLNELLELISWENRYLVLNRSESGVLKLRPFTEGDDVEVDENLCYKITE